MTKEQKNNDPKKRFPTTFLFLLFGVILLVLFTQSFFTKKQAKVSFSHQVEHLVNLDLIQPDENHKVSLKDNLVTFSGQFREAKTDLGVQRFKFLELLETQHELVEQKADIEFEMRSLRQSVMRAADLYLQILGSVPSGEFVIFEDPSRKNGDFSLVLNQFPTKEKLPLSVIKNEYLAITEQATNSSEKLAPRLQILQTHLEELIDQFQSPILGIGQETMKQELSQMMTSVLGANALPMGEQLLLYGSVIAQLEKISTNLEEVIGGSRLSQLRSVRQYREAVDKYDKLEQEISLNQTRLEKARVGLGQMIWYYNDQELSTKALEKVDAEQYNHWFIQAKKEWTDFALNKGLIFKAPDQPRNSVLDRTFKSQEPAPNYMSYLFTLLPILLVVFLLYFVFSRQMKGMGGGAMNFGKSPARLLQQGQNKITFKDVAGIDEAKEELVEVVEFLKNPAKFTALGGSIPKGVLCVGPPGTGKTLIAKAVAGEAGCPFFSIAGSDFVEMFVGVGASRIRDMFDQAKKNAPCIIFIDEIDAVGRHRGAGIGGGHDEREQTLNQLLVEMDGFDTSEGVILMAATNRPDVLDKALLRPGRFDRRVMINLPDIKGRYEILKVHARKIKLDPNVDLMAISRGVPGASGADLKNLLNEAALLAAGKNRSAVTSSDVSEARDKVLYGKERRSLEFDDKEKLTTAYHESGHTIVGVVVEHADPVDKVTIIPRGFSLGATHFLPEKNRLSYWKKEMIDQLAVLMGGRAAEEIFVGDVSSGAQHDFSQATKLARSMICTWGMNEELGLVSYDKMEIDSYSAMNYGEKSYSEETAKQIDQEVKKLLNEAHARARQIILNNKEKVELMTRMLIEFETLEAEDIREIIQGDWDSERKRQRAHLIENRYKKKDPLPPPPPLKPIGSSDKGDFGPVGA